LTKYSKQVVKKNGLTFPVVTDLDNQYAAQLNLDFVLPEKLQEIYKTLGIDLERFNGNDSWVLPMAARFIVDSSGIIRNAEVNVDHTLRPEPEEIIEIMKSLS
jgi:peroxiredoxin